MHGRFRAITISMIGCCAWLRPAVAQDVTVRDGNIYFVSNTGVERRLTNTGTDRDPSLSPDGQSVAFVRLTPDRWVSSGVGDVLANEIWVGSTDGTNLRRVVAGRDSQEMQSFLGALRGPIFSRDGALLFFQSAAWATSGAIHVVDLDSLTERFVVAGHLLELIPCGRYADHLIVNKHKYFLGGGSYDWYWLVSADGVEIGPIGDDTASFKELYVGDECRTRR